MKIQEWDTILLLGTDRKGKEIRQVMRAKKRVRKIRDVGLYNTEKLIGLPYGEVVDINGTEFRILPASITDKIAGIERQAQIITPKDAAQILMLCNVSPGSIVIESGIGSGALTLALANAVKPLGRVITYEIRNDFADVGRRNLELAGLEEFSDIRIGDVTEGIAEQNVDAVILDIPNPWDAIAHAHGALKVGGYCGSYSPTINQVEKTVAAMRENGFGEILTLETLQRDIIVKESGTRPNFDALGHTGYVSIGRRILP